MVSTIRTTLVTATELGLLIGSLACSASPPQPQSKTASPSAEASVKSCLEGFKPDRLDQVLERCNAMVKDHPDHPAPLSERSLVHNLRGDSQQACVDVQAAITLLNRNDSSSTDPLLTKELAVRQAACKQARTIDANG